MGILIKTAIEKRNKKPKKVVKICKKVLTLEAKKDKMIYKSSI
jgi:hypothetical protein